MYTISEDFKAAIQSPSRVIRPYGNVGEYVLNEENIIEFTVESILSNNGLPGIGGAIASKLELTLAKTGVPSLVNKPIVLGVEVLVGSRYEKVPLGLFYPLIDSIKKTANTLKVDCFDRMTSWDKVNYTTKLIYPAYVRDMCAELLDSFGVPIANIDKIPDDLVYQATPMLSIRSILGEMAELMGTNAVMDRNGAVEFRTIGKTPVTTITTDNYIDLTYTSDEDVKITKLSAKGKLLPEKLIWPEPADEKPIEGVELRFTNDSIETEELLEKIYNTFLPMIYTPYEIKLQGMPHIDIGDMVEIIDKDGKTTELSVINHKLIFNGGLISEWSNEAPDGDIVETGSTGTTKLTDQIADVKESGEPVIHFENRKKIEIQSTLTEIATMSVILTGGAEAILHFTASIETPAPITVFIEISNNNFVLPFKPAQTFIKGINLLNFTFPLVELDKSTKNILKIKIRSDSDTVVPVIKSKQAQIIVRGRNILNGDQQSFPFDGGFIDEVIQVETARNEIRISGSNNVAIELQVPFTIKGTILEVMQLQNTKLSI